MHPYGGAKGMIRRQIKWKLLLFYESDFFLRPVFFLFSFNRAMLFILSQIKRTKLKKLNKILNKFAFIRKTRQFESTS